LSTGTGVLNVDDFTLGPMHRIPAPPPLPDDRGIFHESSADDFVRTVQDVIWRLWPATNDCQGIVMCGQMGGLVLTHAAGRAVSNYISWLDRRSTVQHPDGGSYFERFCRLVRADWPARLGNELRPGLPLPFLFYLQQNGNLPADVTPVTLPDYVAARLCHARPVMEWTSSTSMVDVASRDWPRTLLGTLGLGELCLPKLVDFRYQVGCAMSRVGHCPCTPQSAIINARWPERDFRRASCRSTFPPGRRLP
jgi:sugar (pentulose or hexulose) kinase